MSTTMTSTVNGVDLDQLAQTIQAIQGAPSIADFQFRAENAWLGGGHNRSKIAEFDGGGQKDVARATRFVMNADEPPVLLGSDQAPNPVEYVLHALAACLTTSLVYHAAARGVTIRSVRSKLEGDLDLHGFLGLDESIRNGYQQVRVVFRVEADAPEDVIEELVEVAQRRSPVFDIVSNPVSVSVRSVRP
jgi:uncharacterized OsmC-like protein